MKSFAVVALFCLSLLVNCAGSPSQPQTQAAPKTPATLEFVESEYRYLSTDESPRPIEVRLVLNDEDDGKAAWDVTLEPDPEAPIVVTEYKGNIRRSDLAEGYPHRVARPEAGPDHLLVKGSGKLIATVILGGKTLTAEVRVVVE